MVAVFMLLLSLPVVFGADNGQHHPFNLSGDSHGAVPGSRVNLQLQSLIQPGNSLSVSPSAPLPALVQAVPQTVLLITSRTVEATETRLQSQISFCLNVILFRVINQLQEECIRAGRSGNFLQQSMLSLMLMQRHSELQALNTAIEIRIQHHSALPVQHARAQRATERHEIQRQNREQEEEIPIESSDLELESRPASGAHHHQQRRHRARARRRVRASIHGIAMINVQNFDDNVCQHQNIGAIGNLLCGFCDARFWPREFDALNRRSGSNVSPCCRNGRVMIPALPALPQDLFDLFMGNHPLSSHCATNIRRFNSAFAFASFNCNEVRLSGRGPPTFRVQGTCHHLIGPLQQQQGAPANFLQIYFYDTAQARARRFEVTGCADDANDGMIIDILEAIMRSQNRFFSIFSTAMQRARLRSQSREQQEENICVVMLGPDAVPLPTGAHRGQYNEPQSDDVAMLIRSDGSLGHAAENARGITVFFTNLSVSGSGDRLEYIQSTHQDYDPLHYVLFCPSGRGLGWHQDRIPFSDPGSRAPARNEQSRTGDNQQPENLQDWNESADKIGQGDFVGEPPEQDPDVEGIVRRGRRNFVTARQYCASVLQVRDDPHNTRDIIFHGFISRNQGRLNADLYNRLEEAVEQDDDLEEAGTQVILPSSFDGSPRNMRQRYLDAMAMSRSLGTPTLHH
eukprot:g50055.t1